MPTSGDVRAGAGPSASTLPSRERIVARLAGRLARLSRSPLRSSGNTSRGDHATCSPDTGISTLPRRAPNTRVPTTTGTVTESPSTPAGSSTSIELAVAVAAARS